MFGVKDFDVFYSLLTYNYHHKLIEVVWWVYKKYQDLYFTCGRRPDDTGVHGADPCRGIDLRSWIYKDPQELVDFVNDNWIYDPDRPEMMVAILHDAGSGNHIHLQVHPNTIKK